MVQSSVRMGVEENWRATAQDGGLHNRQAIVESIPLIELHRNARMYNFL